MKALAILAACLAVSAASPASAFVHFGFAPHPGPHVVPVPHGDGFRHDHGHGGHGRGGYGLGGYGLGGYFGGVVPDAAPVPVPVPVAAPEPLVIPAPAPFCPAFLPPPGPSGPRIIYIGHHPTARRGPKVIYGTN